MEQLREAIALARNFTPMPAEDQKALTDRVRDVATDGRFELFKSSRCSTALCIVDRLLRHLGPCGATAVALGGPGRLCLGREGTTIPAALRSGRATQQRPTLEFATSIISASW